MIWSKCWLIFPFMASLVPSGETIKCFVGNDKPTPENVVDCDTLGIQREELYCRNITEISGNTQDVQRSCVAMSWFDSTWESIGCHESEKGGTKLIRCTCESDLCNAPIEDQTPFQAILTSRGVQQSFKPLNFFILCPILYFSLSLTL